MNARWARPAVVANPSKAEDPVAKRREVTQVLEHAGLPTPAWYETTEEDPGRGQTERALTAGADLVLACGGDGTVRACASVLAGGTVPLALLPAGTGNLLARNLGISADLAEAATVAASGRLRKIDVPALDGDPFLVMGGSGFDALLFERTSENLKHRVGWAAYVVAGMRAIRSAAPAAVSVEIDGHTHEVTCIGVLVGNVGTLTGGIELLPEAEPDDGLLHVAVLTPLRLRNWAGLASNLLSRRRPKPWQLQTHSGGRVVIDWPAAVPVELDGDLRDPATRLVFTLARSALSVCVPDPAGTSSVRTRDAPTDEAH